MAISPLASCPAVGTLLAVPDRLINTVFVMVLYYLF